jgi:hypothetical protein
MVINHKKEKNNQLLYFFFGSRLTVRGLATGHGHYHYSPAGLRGPAVGGISGDPRDKPGTG